MLRLAAVTVTLACLVATAPPANSIPVASPLPIDDSFLPAPKPAAPPVPTQQRVQCTPVSASTSVDQLPAPQQGLGLDRAWALSRGEGQLVAVIDTGVAPHPRLPRLRGGGDYVSTSDGTADCDAHGTLVAGIIAAQPDPSGHSAFVGIAPGAGILSIRQSSAKFAPSSPNDAQLGPTTGGFGTVNTLAQAVREASDAGATVINISEVSCQPSSTPLDDRALGAALKYAVDIKDVVVVAAAGNVSGNSPCTAQNPVSAPVATLASPAWYDDYVLTVGSVNPDGSPSPFSLAGPWVDVAAVGIPAVSLDPNSSGLVDTYPGDHPSPIGGTSFAAPVIAGIAALVRAREPKLSARQVMERITSTAHGAGGTRDYARGAGIVDALAAVSGPAGTTSTDATAPISAPVEAEPAQHRARDIALRIAVGIAVITMLGLGFTAPMRRSANSAPESSREDPA